MVMSPETNEYGTADQHTASARVSQNCGQILRELIQGAISLPIAAVALILLCDAYYAVKAGAKGYAELRDVLAPVLGLLGTVIGYYFGRVPAERHADTAHEAAIAAHQRELKVRQQVHAGLTDIQQKHNGTKEGGGTDAVNDAINLLRSSL
jgi:hypothetical protein